MKYVSNYLISTFNHRLAFLAAVLLVSSTVSLIKATDEKIGEVVNWVSSSDLAGKKASTLFNIKFASYTNIIILASSI